MTETGSILVVLAERFGAEVALQHAAVAAEALPGAVITALHVQVDPRSTIMPTEEMMSEQTEREMSQEAAAEGAAIRAIFDAWAGQIPNSLTNWEDLVGTEAEQVKQHAARSALLVIAAPAQQTRGYALQAFHTALFDVRKPLLAVPAAHRAAKIDRILVGWQNNEATRRAIEAAASWLRQAATVEVVRVGEAESGELAAAGQFLTDIGVQAPARALAEDGLSDVERLLAEAAAMKADWLVMGAYRHNRIVEWALGGVTRTVLHEARLPLFLMH